MYTNVTSAELSANADLSDWRVLLRRIEASYRATSFPAAATFVTKIADAAETARHHPDIDLRYPGVVHVAITTHATRGLTDADVDLARTISALATAARLTAEPPTGSTMEIAIDAMDIDAIRPFWVPCSDTPRVAPHPPERRRTRSSTPSESAHPSGSSRWMPSDRSATEYTST